jgi:hypothetical protein
MVARKYKKVNTQKLLDEINAAKGVNGVRQLIRRHISPSLRRAMAELSAEFFLMYYLGFRTPEHQRKWIRLWELQFLLELAPRDHGKSWIFAYGQPLYRIYSSYVKSGMRYVPERFLQISKGDSQATKYGNQVRETIETNTWLMEDFGNIQDPKNWLKSYFRCKRQTGSALEKDNTYEMVGILGGITGGHFDDINIDDPLDDENTKTTDRMDTVENWFWGTIWNLREPHTRFRVTGTRKNRRDLYNTLLQSPTWKHNVERAIIKYPMIPDPKNPDRLVQGWLYTTDTGRHVKGLGDLTGEETINGVELLTDDYEVLWPPTPKVDDDGIPVVGPNGKQELFGWGIEALLLDRATQGSTVFDREKQNEISAAEGSVFQKGWLNFFSNDELFLNDQDGFYYLVPERAAA